MLMLAICIPLQMQAQDDQKTIEVTGTVTDETGEPLIGVSVTPKENPSLGVITNIDGVYKRHTPDWCSATSEWRCRRFSSRNRPRKTSGLRKRRTT